MGQQVLLVDDDPVQRKILRRWLAQDGYEILEARDGHEAWQMAQSRPPALVISDWIMPRISGPDLCRLLRSMPTTASCQVILLTSRDDSDSLSAGLEIGANEFLTKPIDGARSRARVRASLRDYAERTRLLAAKAELESQAFTDPLTGAFNRRALDTRLKGLLARPVVGESHSLLILDCDHFKQLNDRYGHQAGDEVLRGFVERVRSHLRLRDSVYRYGGEEFVVLLEHADLEAAMVVAQRLCAAVRSRPFTTSCGSIPVTVSIGVGVATPTDTPQLLIERADQALYQAKRSGRDQAVSAQCAFPPPIQQTYCGFYLFDLAQQAAELATILADAFPIGMVDDTTLRANGGCDTARLQQVCELLAARLPERRYDQVRLATAATADQFEQPIHCALLAQPLHYFLQSHNRDEEY